MPRTATAGHRPYYKQVALHVPSDLEHGFPYRLLRVGREQYTARYPLFRNRLMDVHHLVYVEQGRGWLQTGGYRGPLVPGSVAALCAGTRNDMGPDPEDPMEITWLVLEGDGFPRLVASAGLVPARPCAVIGAAPEPRAIFRELRRGQPGYIWRAQALFWALLARIAAATGSATMGRPPAAADRPVVPVDAPGRPIGPPPVVTGAEALACDDPAIARAIELARVHLQEPDLRLHHLARAASLGRSQFTQRFRRATGVSPRRYLERLRMEEARRMLELDDALPVARVAQLAGFDDPLYFSRRFRAMHGVSPSAYRAVARGGRP
jgi:AraC-like DNA-binding protein